MDPATATLLASAITGGSSILGGILGRQKPHETKTQRTKRHLIDKLVSSLNGKGPYSDLYNFDENIFNKSFVEPAKAKFRNQIAPQIQQEYIATGQQRGTGLDDQLLRAGVDLDQTLNQYMYQAQNDAQNRKQTTINSILNGDNGVAPGQSTGEAAAQATSGYLSSEAFSNSIADILKGYTNQNPNQSAATTPPPTRKGYEPDWKDWKLGDKRWSQ